MADDAAICGGMSFTAGTKVLLASGIAVPEDRCMSWISGRGGTLGGDAADQAGDALDAAAWDALHTAILAASKGDADAHAEVFRRWPGDSAAEGRRASLYLWYLLRYRIADVIGRRPSPEDLRALAVSTYPRFALLIRRDVGQLEATFRTVFESAESSDHLKGGMFLILGTAALGSLLDDAASELGVMRTNLSDWWRRKAAEFHARGVA